MSEQPITTPFVQAFRAEVKERWGDRHEVLFLSRVMAAVVAPAIFGGLAFGPWAGLAALFASLVSVWLVVVILLREMR